MDIVSNGYYLFSWLSGFRNKQDKNRTREKETGENG